ncbi:hypothetical protein EJO69_08795 [Flaviflexus salsibiostraticola]|uniref:Uncharacterized protein n=1 Tax=Flaviflexus salsibiostraticola TaxID=1282737 RepID=A0A3S8ZAB0_9ACTO|nr:hypothetical protein [Flaviflexus salsibiostraticola]AZN30390.1 hypothetical protein EJO69_08795 [Flaviflexus salsibiostraticola]
MKISNGEIDLADDQGKRSDLVRLESEILLMGRKASELILTEPGAVRYARYLDRLERERDRAVWSTRERDPLVHYLSVGGS